MKERRRNPWESKSTIANLCKQLHAEFRPNRITDRNGVRVFLVIRQTEVLAFKTTQDVYNWAMSKLPKSKR